MAAATSVVFEQGRKQFQGLFSHFWVVTATLDPSSVAAGNQADDTVTVPGVAVGDIVLGCSHTASITGCPVLQARVSSANTVAITGISATGVSTADVGSGTVRLLIGRLTV